MNAERAERLGRGLCLLGAALGALALLGWSLDLAGLRRWWPSQPEMNANTALTLLLLGAAGAAARRRPGPLRRLAWAGAAGLVLALAAATALEYALHVSLGIDQVLFASGEGPQPGRMAIPTAAALMLLSAGLLARASPRWLGPAEGLVLAGGLIGFTAAVGQLFGAGPLYPLGGEATKAMAVPTGIALQLIAVGLLLQPPWSATLSLAFASGPGGSVVRRLVPLALLTPLGFGLIAARLNSVDPGDRTLVLAALTVAMAVVETIVLWVTAARLEHSHRDLEQSQARTRELIEQAVDGFFLANLDGRFFDVNQAACSMLGYSRHELLDLTVGDLISDAARLSLSKREQLAGKPEMGEWELRCRDGSFLPVQVSAQILADGRWQAFVRDISERKRAEETLRRLYHAADSATRLRDDLMGVVAHDLRNPLGVILVQAGLLRRRGPEPAQRAAATIEKAARRMNRLIQDLLDVTRMEAGHLSLAREPLDVGPVLADAVDTHRAMTSGASLRLRLVVEGDLPVVWADPDRLLQVLENLLGNAIKFTPPGGNITLAAAARADVVEISVSDTGAGIAEADQPHLFDRFWQAHKEDPSGVGLGLPIAKGIVEAHGGNLWVKSAPARGSTFTFTIPTLAAAQPWTPSSPSPP